MLKIFGNWWKGIKGVQLCACSHFSGYATNLFTCRLTYLAPFARAQFLVSSFFLHIRLQNGCVLFLLRSYTSVANGCVLFLLRSSFFFLSTEYISWTNEPILMKLGHNNHLTSPHIWNDNWPRNCPLGVTGVKKVILAKIHQLLQFTLYGHVTHAYS